MITRLPFDKLRSLLVLFIFLLGFQITSQAQITIQNNTPCNLYIAAVQNDMTTVVPCDVCGPVALNFVPAGGSVTLPANALCGIQQWQTVYWTTTPISTFAGISRNPGLFGVCGPNNVGPCGGTNGNWILASVTGVGPAFVSIN